MNECNLWNASSTERVKQRSELARTLAANGYTDVLISSRETISEFGVKEWTLIALLDNENTDEITVPDHCWSAAYTLAKADILELEETDDTLIARKKHTGGVFVRIL